MSLSSGEMSAADVAAVVGNNRDGSFGNWGDGSFWIIVLFIFALMNGGWNNGNGNNGCYGVQQGFDQAALMNGLTNIATGQAAGFANAEVAANSRQMADMQQMFNLSTQFSNCCCENRLASANLEASLAREACANRQALSDGIQKVMDQMCQDKIDAKNEQIANLRQQLSMMQLASSQSAQTQALIANNELQTAALEQYLAPTPRPAYVVQNPNCCNQNYYNGCGCGM